MFYFYFLSPKLSPGLFLILYLSNKGKQSNLKDKDYGRKTQGKYQSKRS